MDANSYGLIEMVFSFGLVLAIGFQQLRSVKKARERLRAREEAAKAASAKATPESD